MSRRPVLFALSLVALATTACADATAPTPSARLIQPSGQAANDVVDPETCGGGYLTSTGRSC
jgi:hypothetical protein